jgi:hypothetical protein
MRRMTTDVLWNGDLQNLLALGLDVMQKILLVHRVQLMQCSPCRIGRERRVPVQLSQNVLLI